MTKENFIIDVHHLQKSFNGLLAVKDISLQVNRGEIFGFLGPNGSGKTTTIRMLCGLLTPQAGSGFCLGYDILTESKSIKKHVGYIPQYFSLYKSLTVAENIHLMAELYGITNRKKRVADLMDKLGLLSRKDQLSGTLSGGWKQRLSLACALVYEPFLLLLDEPTASVDPKSRREFWQIMQELSAEGITILLSSHNMDEVEQCHRIAYVYYGTLLMTGSIHDIIKNINLCTWQVSGDNLVLLAKQLEATPGIDQVIPFFDTLHVSGKDHDALNKAVAPFFNKGTYLWQLSEATLDDVFIWLSTYKVQEKAQS
jgi:ABC-2 type transport system ATP-binding protein